jgi:hypothetical protein
MYKYYCVDGYDVDCSYPGPSSSSHPLLSLEDTPKLRNPSRRGNQLPSRSKRNWELWRCSGRLTWATNGKWDTQDASTLYTDVIGSHISQLFMDFVALSFEKIMINANPTVICKWATGRKKFQYGNTLSLLQYYQWYRIENIYRPFSGCDGDLSNIILLPIKTKKTTDSLHLNICNHLETLVGNHLGRELLCVSYGRLCHEDKTQSIWPLSQIFVSNPQGRQHPL